MIGRGGRYIKGSDWRNHVYGYMNLNDVSARDYQTATSQWTMGRTSDTFGPMGPWIVTADEIADRTTCASHLRSMARNCRIEYQRADLYRFRSGGVSLKRDDSGAGRHCYDRNARRGGFLAQAAEVADAGRGSCSGGGRAGRASYATAAWLKPEFPTHSGLRACWFVGTEARGRGCLEIRSRLSTTPSSRASIRSSSMFWLRKTAVPVGCARSAHKRRPLFRTPSRSGHLQPDNSQ